VHAGVLRILPLDRRKNGHPGHPQTQGKIERFHQTLKKWLTQQPLATTLAELQTQLDRFHQIYNHHRPHRALAGATPAHAYHATPKAGPGQTSPDIDYRVRLDRVDQFGKLTLRRTGRLHHLGIGKTHAHIPELILTTATDVTVINRHTGAVLSRHDIDPERNYWRNKTKEPG
jgi:hypothetical protein